jgi:hypothetical protein
MQYPRLFTSALEYFALLVDASRWLGERLSADCFGWSNFNHKWMITVAIFPLGLVLFVLVLHSIERCVQHGLQGDDAVAAHQQLREKLMQRLFFVVFFSYPSVCKVVFSSFNCV